jgi:hypothetical protein
MIDWPRSWRSAVLTTSIFFLSSFLLAAEIHGQVVSVDRGEPLGRVQVSMLIGRRSKSAGYCCVFTVFK